MLDISNKNVDYVNSLIIKYAKILELAIPQEQSFLAVAIDTAVNYFNIKCIDNKIRTSIIFILKKILPNINSESEIIEIIEDFSNFHKNEFLKYCDDMIFSSDVDKEYEFANYYIKNFNNKIIN